MTKKKAHTQDTEHKTTDEKAAESPAPFSLFSWIWWFITLPIRIAYSVWAWAFLYLRSWIKWIFMATVVEYVRWSYWLLANVTRPFTAMVSSLTGW
jgi:hypothetical protein